MRLVTWNCCAGPVTRKLAALWRLRADIAVVPECPFIEVEPGSSHWVGDDRRKGIGVFARAPYAIAPVRPPAPLPRYVIPLQVSGPTSFLLLAVWAMPDRPHRYVRAVLRAVDILRPLIAAQPTVAMGDFNSNTIWDHEHPADRSHSALVRRLDGLSLTSAYHAHREEQHGAERTPTYYQYRHADEPYHLDYCFIPSVWVPRLRAVRVGSHRKWRTESDHVPLVCEIDGAGEA